MAENSKIEWTDHSFTPWRGCHKISPACHICYADTWAKRTGKDIWGRDKPREFASESYWRKPRKWDTEAWGAGARRLVFCSSLSDICEDRPDLVASRLRLMELIEGTPNLIWLLLTKRPENFEKLFGSRWGMRRWPDNVWVGATVEGPDWAWRLKYLCRVPALRFVSMEPLLGRVVLQGTQDGICYNWLKQPEGVQWVIVGGESGAGARAMNIDEVRRIRSQCALNGIPLFVKQLGATWARGRRKPIVNPDGSAKWVKDTKGDWMPSWPVDLRIRQFPTEAGPR